MTGAVEYRAADRAGWNKIGITTMPDPNSESDAEINVRTDVPLRAGWADASKRIAESGDDALVMGEFGNSDDCDLTW